MGGLALQLRAIAARAPMLDRPAIAAAADAVEENARLRRDHMAHWCAMDHEPIRHNNSEHEQCPMCRLLNENSALAAGFCIVPGGLIGDEGGTPVCVMRAERDEARALATCGCGDEFTTHDPGTCGACMAQNDSGLRIALQKAEAERDALQRKYDCFVGSECAGTIVKGEGYVPACRTMRAERDAALERLRAVESNAAEYSSAVIAALHRAGSRDVTADTAIDAIAAERDAALADAARYRWLREHLPQGTINDCDVTDAASWDTAIDAALKGSP